MAIVLAFCSVLLLATFPGWHYETDETTGSELEVKPFPPMPVVIACRVIILLAAMLSLVVSLWQHTGAVAARSFTVAASYGNVAARTGTAAITLSWIACALLFLVVLGLWAMYSSMRVLDRMADE